MPNGNQSILEQLLEQNPLMKSGLKRIQKNQDTQIDEAMQQGVSAEHILAQILKPKGAFDPGGVEQGQQGQITGVRQPGWVADLFTPGGARGDPKQLLEQLLGVAQIQGQQIQTQLGEQELAGEKPLQKGEREKIGLQAQADIVKELIKKDQEGYLKPNDLYQGFEQASKMFIGVRDSHARVEAAAQDPTAAGDLALIFNFMKVLDPGSVVREGEFATAQNAAGVPVRVMNIYNKVLSGKRLAPQQRADFLDRSRRLFKSSQDQQQKTTSEFSRLAIKNQLNPEVLFRDVGLVLQQQQGVSGGQGTTKSGNIFRRVQ